MEGSALPILAAGFTFSNREVASKKSITVKVVTFTLIWVQGKKLKPARAKKLKRWY